MIRSNNVGKCCEGTAVFKTSSCDLIKYSNCGITLKRATSGEARPRGQRLDNTAPKKHGSGGGTVFDFTGPGIEPQTFCVNSHVFNHELNYHTAFHSLPPYIFYCCSDVYTFFDRRSYFEHVLLCFGYTTIKTYRSREIALNCSNWISCVTGRERKVGISACSLALGDFVFKY